VEHFFVGNDEAFPADFIASARSFGRDNAFFYPPNIGGGSGHGSKMASIAAGILDGVAPRANLFLAKGKGQWNTGKDNQHAYQNGPYRPNALNTVFKEIRSHIKRKRDAEPNAKSVVNMSWGKH
jgi:hypothetical protein